MNYAATLIGCHIWTGPNHGNLGECPPLLDPRRHSSTCYNFRSGEQTDKTRNTKYPAQVTQGVLCLHDLLETWAAGCIAKLFLVSDLHHMGPFRNDVS